MKRNNPQGLLILGASGSGKSTLGRCAADALGIALIELDDFVWRQDTPIPFSEPVPREEKIARLTEAAHAAGEFVMAGSINSIHEYFDPMFRLAVYLTADTGVRAERVRQRKLRTYGDRVLPGGDMYDANCAFLESVAHYDDGTDTCMAAQHRRWMRALTCPILHLDGTRPLAGNTAVIAEAYRKIQNS